MAERETENIVLEDMNISIGKNKFGFVFAQGDVSNFDKINIALKQAGGKPSHCSLEDISGGGPGKAQPEFIITFNSFHSTIIVIECKKSLKDHQSGTLDFPKRYAVDGVLYYAKFLKQFYNVIAIAVSGIKRDKLKISTFYWQKGLDIFQELSKGKDTIYTPENYLKLVQGKMVEKAISIEEIRKLALVMHNNLRTLKMTERNKPVFIAGILIALKNKEFSEEYQNVNSFDSLLTLLQKAIDKELSGSDIRKEKIEDIKSHFKIIGKNVKLKSIPLGQYNSLLWYIEQLENKIKPMMDYSSNTVDALGIFYHEFVKYSGGDGSGLGIVLTPQHLTEFMVDLAEVNKSSKVVDICCGSGSFLVTTMGKMFQQATEKEISRIKANSLFGVESDDDIYTLAIANMIVRGDGKSNIIFGDCFDSKIIKNLKSKQINVGLINPPYSQKDHCELEFVNNLLNILTTGGIGVAVVPMSCAIGTKYKSERERLFKNHTLKAVFSMPDDIFLTNKANTNVCVMVWEAHKPHDVKKNTYFGYYKDDGFVKAKKLGRIDKFNKWAEIKKEWLTNYENKIIKPGMSCMKPIKWDEEWLCEAYMETDFAKLDRKDFLNTVKKYCVYLLQNGLRENINSSCIADDKNCKLDIKNWKWFNFVNIFNYRKRGKRLKSEDRESGNIFYFSASEDNNGLTDSIANPLFVEENALIYTTFGDGFFVECKFTTSDEVTILKDIKLNKYNGLFIATVIGKDKYRYRFGRKAFYNKIQNVKIKLPAMKHNNEYEPDWEYMEKYIKSLPYSSNL